MLWWVRLILELGSDFKSLVESTWFQGLGESVKFNIHIFQLLLGFLCLFLLLFDQSLLSLLLSGEGFLINLRGLLFLLHVGLWGIL